MNNGGDVLARGGASAQFAGAGSEITSFENDFIYLPVVELCNKYVLSQAEYDEYAALREKGERLPDLQPQSEELSVDFTVTDRRLSFSSPAVVEMEKKFPDPGFDPPATLMDRILVMVISDDP